MPETFDKRYYDRFYRNPRTRVADAESTARLARFVCAWLDAFEVPVTRVLDVGCGLGWWRDPVREAYPRCDYVAVEASPYLVDEYGWELGSVVDWHADEPFDLVICQGVLQYLTHAQARAALDNLATLTRGVLFLEALTAEDWRGNCDRQRTDGKVYLRSGSWYRRRLAAGFENCGSGLFARKTADVAFFDLERLSGA